MVSAAVAWGLGGTGCGSGISGSVDANGTSSSDGNPGDAASLDAAASNFSFFVTSLVAMQRHSDNPNGFGGDLRYGETGPGAGLRGADKLCRDIAEVSLPGAGGKTWRAFLSAADDGSGNQVDARDRVGQGPWHDRLGRLVAPTLSDLLADRPANGDATIRQDLPNEDGVPNHRPDPLAPPADNHHVLTGSNASGTLRDPDSTCLDWTSALGDQALEGRPWVGLSWPRNFLGPGSPSNWMSALEESGCAAGINLEQTGPPDPADNFVGSGGGYGAIYCFALP